MWAPFFLLCYTGSPMRVLHDALVAYPKVSPLDPEACKLVWYWMRGKRANYTLPL